MKASGPVVFGDFIVLEAVGKCIDHPALCVWAELKAEPRGEKTHAAIITLYLRCQRQISYWVMHSVEKR